ncbi:MAG: hypothetical protein K2X45_21445 [Phreatobacter sp.]|nr:hypothetical protein [Phreatobacter sp.]
MSRKFALAAIAVAALTAAPMLATDAQAQSRRGNALAIGLAAGVGGLLIGSAIANAQPRYQVEHRFHAEPRRFHAEPRGFSNVSYGYGYGYEPRCSLVERENRWGDIVVRRVCR